MSKLCLSFRGLGWGVWIVENDLNNLELAALAHEGNLLVKCIKVVKSYQ